MKRLAAVAVLVTMLAVPVPAAASAPTGDQSYLDRMLAPADIPRALGAAPTDPFKSDRGSQSPSYVIGCWPDDEAQAAPSGFEAEVETTRPGGRLYREVDEVVSLFPSASAAKRAWRALAAQARSCDGKVVVENAGETAEDGTITRRYSSGTTDGGSAVWVSETDRWRMPDPKENTATVTYTVYRRSDRAIVTTWTYINGKARTNASERRALQDLSATLAARW